MTASVVILLGLLMLIPAAIALLLVRHQDAAIRDLREARDRLYVDNQRLMETVAATRGTLLDLAPRPEKQVAAVQRPAQPPYWTSKA